MERQWGIREPNLEERICAGPWCGKVFFAKHGSQKYCSPSCVKKANQRSVKKAQDKRKPQRIAKAIREREEEPGLIKGFVNDYFTVNIEHGSASVALRMAGRSLTEDPVYELVEDDREEVLDWISKQQIVYGKYIDKIEQPTQARLILVRLEQAINNVPERMKKREIVKMRHERLEKRKRFYSREFPDEITIKRRKRKKSKLDWLA